MKKLRIAVTADTMTEATGVINLVNAPFAPRQLVEVLAELGAVPLILPDTPGCTGDEYADLFDGLILPGGPDVDPRFYGEQPIWQLGRTNYKRDIFELNLVNAACRQGKAIFGICRGCQLINVAFGGTIYQDLPAQCPSAYIQHAQKAPGGYPVHDITIEEGSVLFQSLGASAQVNSRHHQAIHTVGRGLNVTALAPDGTIEGIESEGIPSVVAVQWHPENMWMEHPEMKQLFADYIQRVRAYL